MARFHHAQVSNKLELESNLNALVGKDLAGMGHNVASIDGAAVGGFQSILVMPNTPAITSSSAQPSHGFYRAGSDPRKDGQAVGW
jgi:gamma-glutamyltranspeptidase/glutathione hydrolase